MEIKSTFVVILYGLNLYLRDYKEQLLDWYKVILTILFLPSKKGFFIKSL